MTGQTVMGLLSGIAGEDYSRQNNSIQNYSRQDVDAMTSLVDRDAELGTLEREYARTEASFVVVYGRRRVGKTALVSRFIRDRRALYCLATEEPELQNLEGFQSIAADSLNNIELLSSSPAIAAAC